MGFFANKQVSSLKFVFNYILKRSSNKHHIKSPTPQIWFPPIVSGECFIEIVCPNSLHFRTIPKNIKVEANANPNETEKVGVFGDNGSFYEFLKFHKFR